MVGTRTVQRKVGIEERVKALQRVRVWHWGGLSGLLENPSPPMAKCSPERRWFAEGCPLYKVGTSSRTQVS